MTIFAGDTGDQRNKTENGGDTEQERGHRAATALTFMICGNGAQQSGSQNAKVSDERHAATLPGLTGRASKSASDTRTPRAERLSAIRMRQIGGTPRFTCRHFRRAEAVAPSVSASRSTTAHVMVSFCIAL